VTAGSVRDGRPAPGTGAPSVLQVTGLTVHAGATPLVVDVHRTLAEGERVGLIGESGSGKTVTALALLGLLPDELSATGSVRFRGTELLGRPEREVARLRGDRMAMVFQEPMTALDPLQRVGRQVAEVLRLHGRATKDEAATRAVDLLRKVELPEPELRARSWPHQLSGGQRQRVMLAMAIANDPDILVCDEPTTALDVTVQARVLQLIHRLVAEEGSALLFITHDLAVVSGMCQRVLVMYGGRVVEEGPTGEVFEAPRHPYTRGLLDASAATTDPTHLDHDGRLPAIPGQVPPAGRFPAGCVFRTRCPRAQERCAELPPLEPTGPGRRVACWFPIEDGP
jgi:peptide/nickel transport system ATP-binding protein